VSEGRQNKAYIRWDDGMRLHECSV